MAQADGQVLIDTKINTDGMEKGFDKLVNGVDKIADHVEKIGNLLEKNFSGKAVDAMADAATAAEGAGQRINAAFSGNGGAPINKTLENAAYKVRQLEEQYANIENELKTADINDKSTDRLAAQKAKVYDQLAEARRRLALEIAAAAQKEAAAEEKASAREAKAAERKAKAEERAQQKRMKAAMKPMTRFGNRMREIITGALFFNLFSRGLSTVTQYFGAALKSNEQFTASFARLKGALLTAFQPIYEVVAPALIYLMNILATVASAIAQFFATISGQSYSEMKKKAEALHKQADGIDAVGKSAKKAKKALAGFDEINRLSFADQSAGASAIAIAPDFSAPEPIKNLDTILEAVGAVTAALAAWKISSIFTGDLSKIAGIALTVGGGFEFAFNWLDAFNNGIDWENLTGMMIGLGVAVGGLALAFGSVGAAIGLLIGGFAMVVVSVIEWVKTGELGEEACMTLVLGLEAIGIAISVLTGGPIPAIIAAIAGIVIACVTNGDKIKEALNGVLSWIRGFFMKDWTKVFGEDLGAIFNAGAEIVMGVVDAIFGTLNGLVDFIQGVFTGNWKQAWEGVTNIFKSIWGGIGGVIQGVINGICAGMNAVIRALNRINVKIPEWVPIWGGKKFGLSLKEITPPQIPWLAKGAVIPANNPFLAVLGDQKHGTNIEAPLSTIEEAVERVMSRHVGGMSDDRIISLLSQILEAILGIEIDGETLNNAMENYKRKRAVSLGG